ncbi:transposase family protein [Nitrosomonas sp. Nm51]|uniref:transposase family protein n=1 Tax=Nitrosomonas sp. Nm51 TaxID=133720 RepID=UPI001C4312DC|nr:transposase family protein [Nitrosomonas sp. Nm51]
MNALPAFFNSIPDPRRTQGRRHRLDTIPAIATGAILCGRVGYKGIAEWAQSLSQDARARFQCYYKQERYHVPGEYIICDTLVRVEQDALDHALRHWSGQYSAVDESLSIDGKTMRSAIDSEGRRIHIVSAIGHNTLNCHAQKKSKNAMQATAL